MSEIKLSELSKKEKAWIKKLEKVFNECPSKRIGCYTIGDPCLTFYDITTANKQGVEPEDSGVSEAGLVFDWIRTPMNIQGVAG